MRHIPKHIENAKYRSLHHLNSRMRESNRNQEDADEAREYTTCVPKARAGRNLKNLVPENICEYPDTFPVKKRDIHKYPIKPKATDYSRSTIRRNLQENTEEENTDVDDRATDQRTDTGGIGCLPDVK